MDETSTSSPSPPERDRPPRLWPGLLIAAVILLARYGLPRLVPEAGIAAVFIGLFGGLAVVVWWLFFSRAPLAERLLGVVAMLGGLFVARAFLHESLATGGMGMIFFVYAVPVLALVFVAWAVLSRSLGQAARLATMVATIALACGAFPLLKTGGVTGGIGSDFSWRWTPTPEERLLAASEEPVGLEPSAFVAEATAAWPGFRGARRDGVVEGVRIATDWSATPPVELWRRAVGPGWSSFAVRSDLVYTQEQRGEEEVVSCYRLSTGEPVWRHGDPVRFWESNAGAGPRSTPALAGDRVYTLGATGVVNALDAATGARLWSRDGAADAAQKTPMWGFSGSPLVLDDVVVVAVAGTLLAYDLDSGELRWSGPSGGDSYSSPHRVTLSGVEQVLLLNAAGLHAVAPADGRVLWQHDWGGFPIVQPALAENGDLLIGVDAGSGLRRLAVSRDGAGWSAEERWTSKRLKPYFNDFVVHEGHAYGFDGAILASVELESGERNWKGGRYGAGQMLLLRDQDMLLVLSEKGELALVGATPDGYVEHARTPGIEGKTWNHPVLVDDLLLVRNDEEMLALRLALEPSNERPPHVTQVR